ncbi:hypothetical protein SAMN04490248_10178 [Salinihabitans flavidus]|uniref:Uncharacterized protein n=1 Tax=Salinihabitans flavidus TaxID=569882 RepID=A0A1H8LBZ4_9RHOB|nr:hypothetical protein [Salinihabitans flavidus]SEO02651.1 hypothetical protein SAMN04490248_10178 [Salinihabitans flavidus]
MIRSALLLAALAAPLPATAQMSAQEFDAYTQGKTLYYLVNGIRYGIEKYLPGRRVRWAYLDDECVEGYWYPEGETICFVYEHNPDPQCWIFELGENGLRADFANSDDGSTAYEVEGTGEDLICPGPKVGV